MTGFEIVQEALGRLDSANGRIVLDFSPVDRIDSRGLRALEGLIASAATKGIDVAIHSANVGVYKVLKLANLKWHAI